MVGDAMMVTDAAQALRRNGYWHVPGRFPHADGIVPHLVKQPAYDGHVIPQGDRIERSLDEAMSGQSEFCCHPMSASVSIPHWFAFACLFQPIAEAYFGEPALMYSLNGFWKRASTRPGWHWDTDDRKQVVLFMYGTDITGMGDGPHGYQRGTHTIDRPEIHPWHPSGETAAATEYFYGPAGTCFMTNPAGTHNGISPVDGKWRLLLWARWGVSDPPKSYLADELSPVSYRLIQPAFNPPSEVKRATRLVVDWDN